MKEIKGKELVSWFEEDFECPLFPVSVHILIFKDLSDFKYYYKELTKVPYSVEITSAWYAFAEDAIDPTGHQHVFLSFPEDCDSRPDIWAHEAVHGVNKIFKAVGQKLDLNNDEAQAYLTQYLYERIDRCFKDKLKEDGKQRRKRKSSKKN